MFMAALCISLVVLSAFFLLFMLYTKTLEAEAGQEQIPAEIEYTPTLEENLDGVLFGCHTASDNPGVILFFSYQATAGKLYLLPIPPETVVECHGRTDTLAGHYAYEGIRGGRNGVRALLELTELRYLRTDKEGISLLADFLGGVEYTFSRDCIIGEEPFWKGQQLLDGRRIAVMLFAEPITRQQELLDLLAEKLPSVLTDRYDKLENAVFSCCETDLSRFDFLLRKTGAENGLVIERLTLAGEYSADNSSFIPDRQALDILRQQFRPG